MLTRVTQTPERGGVLAFILVEGARDSAWACTRERTRSWGKRGIGSPERISAFGAREGCRGKARESASHLPGERGIASSEARAPKIKILTSLEFSRDGSPTGANPAVTFPTP